MLVIGIILTVFVVFYGSYANPYWKLHKDADRYANGLVRALIGIPGWAAVILLMIGNVGGMILALLATAVLMLIPILKMRKDGVAWPRYLGMILMASMGAYARILLCWSLIGIVPARLLKRAAEIGWNNTAWETIQRSIENEKRDAKMNAAIKEMNKTIEELNRIDAENRARKAAEEAANRPPEVEVYKEDEYGRMKRLQTNSDNSMYRDPDDGEWHKIRK